MRQIALFLLVLGTALSGASSLAAPGPGGGGARHGGGGHGGHGYWGGGYRPGYGYGGWYGYPRYGWGLGFAYGVGWGLAASYPYYWGAPGYYNYGYPYGYYPYGYAVTAPAPGWDEVAYVQQSQTLSTNPAPQQPATGYWYYCTAPAGYYPYVQQCSRPWVQVQPQAAAAPAQ